MAAASVGAHRGGGRSSDARGPSLGAGAAALIVEASARPASDWAGSITAEGKSTLGLAPRKPKALCKSQPEAEAPGGTQAQLGGTPFLCSYAALLLWVAASFQLSC